MEKIGFIGLGTMGSGMVQNLLKNGFNVTVFNRTKSKADGIKHQNITIADSPKDAIEKSDIVITCVKNDSALEDVLFSKNGVFEALGKGKALIDCSTVSIELTQKIAQECDKKNAEFLDAPITGSKLAAEGGTLMFMVGGKKEVLESLMRVFNAMGKKAVYCGENTYGQKAKIALNLGQSLILQSYLEALMLGLKEGVSIEAMAEIFENSGAKSAVGSFKLNYIMKNDFEPHFKLELMDKDIKLAMSEIKKLKIDLPLSSKISGVFDLAMEKGWEKEDWSAIAKLLEENSKMEF